MSIIYLNENKNINITKAMSNIRNFYAHCMKWKYATKLGQERDARGWTLTIFRSSEDAMNECYYGNKNHLDTDILQSVNGKLAAAYKDAIKDAEEMLGEDFFKSSNRNEIWETFFSAERIFNHDVVLGWVVKNAQSPLAKSLIADPDANLYRMKRKNTKYLVEQEEENND